VPEEKNASVVELRKVLPKTQPVEATAFRATKFESWPCRRPMVYVSGFSLRINVVIIRHLVLWKCNCKGEWFADLGVLLVLVVIMVGGEAGVLYLRFFLPGSNRNRSLRGDRNFDAFGDREKGAFVAFLMKVQVFRRSERSRRTL